MVITRQMMHHPRHLLALVPLALSKVCLPSLPVPSSLPLIKVSKNIISQIFILQIWSIIL